MTAEKKEIELRGRCGTCLFNDLLLKHENGVVAFEKEGCSLGQRALKLGKGLPQTKSETSWYIRTVEGL